MSNLNIIKQKLGEFIKKYYINRLIKGTILFTAITGLYCIITLFVEYMLWLNPKGRLVLFWLFIGVALAFFITFIAIPLCQLFKLRKGINHEQASKLIGNHFPQVNDKLLNILQLSKSNETSDLLLASIEQKSKALKTIPFKKAISFKSNITYLKYLAIPVAIVVLSLITGKINWFSDSYERVINYETAFEPPAPFQFFVLNDSLQAIEGNAFKLNVATIGDIVPENVKISYDNQVYFLQPTGNGNFQHVFALPKKDMPFQLSANNVNSKPYTLQVLNTPNLLHFEMHLNYPNYINKKNETLKSNGAALVPEGTKVTWSVATKSTDAVYIYAKDTLQLKNNSKGIFKATKQLFKNFSYNITTSNRFLKDYENLAYSINVLKDAYPELNIKMQRDSLDKQSLYFYGQATDDYGIRKVNLVYYPENDQSKKKYIAIETSKSNFTEFVTAFPNQLNVKNGVNYQLYFEAFDNDAIHNYKRTKSNIFNYRKRTQNEEEQKQLQNQKNTINAINSTFNKLKQQDLELNELSKTQKEKKEFNFNDKKKLDNFLKRQKQQEQLMKNFNKQLQNNLNNFQKNTTKKDTFKEELQKRLKQNEATLKKNEALLKELEALKDKINKEEFSKKLDELVKQNKNKKRSMKQLLELTKRFYVLKKTEKIANALENLSKKQEELSNKDHPKNEQKKLNDAFKQLQKSLDTLENDNRKLQKPTKIPRDEFLEDEINFDQQKALDALNKQEKLDNQNNNNQQQQNKAKKQQKKAAKKMKSLSAQMKQSIAKGRGNQMQEDADMLRQILDNLLLYSFDQESLMKKFKAIGINHNNYGNHVIQQHNLREHFKHIDDSLFAMSLRQPKISEKVNTQITNVYYNIDKALDQLTENRIYQGVSSQQYAVTASNELASFLSDILDNMEMQMNPSSGQGKGKQLPDIIMSQEQLNNQVKKQLKQNGQQKSAQNQNQQKSEQPSQKGKKENNGEQGENGQKGELSDKNNTNQQSEDSKNRKENNKKGNAKHGNGEKRGDKKEGYGEGGTEEQNAELFKIYQQQQKLRQALEERQLLDKIKKGKNTPSVGELIRQMENIEADLLNYGITNEVLSKMMNLQHQMLKLDKASFLQDDDKKRQSKTNNKIFSGISTNQIPTAKQYFNTIEILNRQALPLKTQTQKKVQTYFKSKND